MKYIPERGWHFLPADCRLAYGDNRLVCAGETYTVASTPVLCESGLHWSPRVIDALQYDRGPILCRVESVEGHDIIKGDDKAVSTARKVIAMADASDMLREFARKCASDVFWKYFKREEFPDVALWLDTGNESYRSAAYSAPYSAAKSAAQSATWSAAWSAARSAPWSAAWSAARSAAESAAWSAAQSAAESAAWSAAESAAKDEILAKAAKMGVEILTNLKCEGTKFLYLCK